MTSGAGPTSRDDLDVPSGNGVAEYALSRRRFLGALTAIAGASLLPGLSACGTDQPAPATASPMPVGPTPAPTATPITSNPAYAALRELQAVLRASPEHLRQRAEEIAATRDLDAIAEFVRTEIAVLPSAPGRDPLTDSPFGARGTLRAAAGTLRDRIEVAAWMLERAGIAATRAQMARPDQLDAATLYAAQNRRFEADVDRIASIAANAGFPIEVPATEVDPAPFTGEVDSLVDQLSGLVPADLRSAMGAALDLPASIPILQVDSAAGPAWVLAIGGEGVRRDPPPGLYLSLADPASPPVEVVVEAVMRPPRGQFADTGVVHELVRGTWTSGTSPADSSASASRRLAIRPVWCSCRQTPQRPGSRRSG